MYISLLSGCNKNVSFGYNKEFHKDVQRKLKVSNGASASFLVKLDKTLLSTEDQLILMEKLGLSFTRKYLQLSESLIDEKRKLAGRIDEYDSRLNYSTSLINQYKDEIGKVKSINGRKWRARLYSALKVDAEKRKSELKSKLMGQIDEIFPQLGSDSSAVSKSKSGVNIVDLVPLYIPNEYSPRGLSDIVGSQTIKKQLKDDVIPYLSCASEIAQDYNEYGIRSPRGLLFYGPPGCGKTFVTKALAAETHARMYTMDVSKVGSMYVNKSAVNIRNVFEYIFKQAHNSDKPIILFMDEVDSLAFKRSDSSSGQEDAKVVTTLLKMIETARDNNVVVIAATNRYDMLDDAFKDRFDGQIYFPLPDVEQIENLVTSSLLSRSKGLELGYDEDSIKILSKMLIGFSNRAIIEILDDAAKLARNRSRDNIRFEDVKLAIETTEHEKINESQYRKASQKNRAIGFMA